MGIISVWLIDTFFLQDCLIYCMSVTCLFYCSEFSRFCNSYYLFTLLFLSNQIRHVRKMVSSCFILFTCICGRAKCYRATMTMCGVMYGRVAALCSICSLRNISERRRAALNEAGRSLGVNCNEETHIRELNSVQFTCNSIIHCLCTINSSTLDVGIIASVLILPNSPS
jgi:hypothetical protein